MIAKGRSHFECFVEDKNNYLEWLLGLYPDLYIKWRTNQIIIAKEVAIQSAEGDNDIERDIYNSESSCLNVLDETEHLFFEAILLMAYSHYESVVTSIASKCKSRPNVMSVCESCDKTLSKESLDAFDFLDNQIRPLRNYLVHNNAAEPRNAEAKRMTELAKEYKGINCSGDCVEILDDRIIVDTIKHSRTLLKELCVITVNK